MARSKEEIKEYKRQWHIKNKEKIIAKATAWNKEHVERRKEIVAKYNVSEYARQKNMAFRRKCRRLALEHYSDGKLDCNCCGENEYLFLTVDHINGNGNKHRKEISSRGGHHFYAWLRRNNWPEGFQVLCFNCNMAKGFFGICPHEIYEIPQVTFHPL